MIRRSSQPTESDPDDCAAPFVEDGKTEAALLSLILELHPAQLTESELIRQMQATPIDFARRDAIDRALRELVASGLAHRHGEFVVPTRAALRFDELAWW